MTYEAGYSMTYEGGYWFIKPASAYPVRST